MMRVATWNCRGFAVNSRGINPTVHFVKWFTNHYIPHILFLSETKAKALAILMGDCENSTGGLFLAWSNVVKLNILEKSKNFIVCFIDCMWNEKRKVGFVRRLQPSGVLVTKIGGKNTIKGQNEFLSQFKWKLINGLYDLHSSWVRYTWSNLREGEEAICETLDRGLANEAWLSEFPDAEVINLPIMLTDHGPIMLITKDSDRPKNTPYKLDSWCLYVREVNELTRSAWKTSINGSHMFIL
ncbi:Mycinamicin VI 2''-O-methyltransferase [Bienertia sinuspersici]